MNNNNNNNTVSNNSANLSVVDLKEICNLAESRYHAGERVTLLGLSKEYGVNPIEIRKALLENYGSRVSFTRGRAGGIRIA
jgi:hypothetical protein